MIGYNNPLNSFLSGKEEGAFIDWYIAKSFQTTSGFIFQIYTYVKHVKWWVFVYVIQIDNGHVMMIKYFFKYSFKIYNHEA